MKYDPTKIQPIRHFKDGEIVDDAMAELLEKPESLTIFRRNEVF